VQSIVEQNYLPNTVYPTIKTSHTGSEVDISADIGSDLWMLAESERKSVRIYLRAVLSDMGYYAPLLQWLRPSLEYIRESRREVSPEALQATIEHDYNLLQELCDRVFSRTMAQAIRSNPTIEDYKRADLALRIENCGRLMGYHVCPTGHLKADKQYCDMPKLCRRCARIEAYKKGESLYERCLPILSRMPSGYEFRFVTCTTIPSGDIRADAELVIDAWAKTYRGKFKDDYSAAWRRVEVGAENHMVHVHSLVLSPYVQQAELSEYWEKRTGASVVDIRIVRGHKDLKKTCYEVSKYVTDPDKHIEKHGLVEGIKQLSEMAHDLRRLKLSQTYGMLRADVFERRMGEAPPESKEQDPCHCDKCGKLWSEYVELHEPRGPPDLRVISV
jgi:hypothetical protein